MLDSQEVLCISILEKKFIKRIFCTSATLSSTFSVLYLWTSASSLWQCRPTTVLCHSCLHSCGGNKVWAECWFKEMVEHGGRELNFSFLLRSACNWVTVMPVSYWGSLEFLDQTKMSYMVSFLLLCSPFPWENQREKGLFSTACNYPSFMTRQVLPLGSCQAPGVELEPLAFQEKCSEATSWVTQADFLSQWLNRDRGMWSIFPSPHPVLERLLAQPEMPSSGCSCWALPSLPSAELLVSLLLSALTVSFPKLKITRMKTPFKNQFSPFFSFSYLLTNSCLIFHWSHDYMTE